MKYASAMKYGGELVAAIECDYDSFKQLVPLCPNCKEPVYLRAGGDRISSKGKPYKIGAHWCHFKGVSDEQVASCENRVNGYSEKDKQRIAAKARGQRLKLLQRWFWSVFTFYNPDFQEGFTEVSEFVEESIGFFHEIHKEYIEIQDLESMIKKVCAAILSKESTLTYSIEGYADTGAIHLYKFTPRLLGAINSNSLVQLHVSQTKECLIFLMSAKQFHLYKQVMSFSLEECLYDYSQQHCNGEGFIPTKSVLDWASFQVFFNLIAQLLVIPWASEFQRLEAESQ